MAKSYKQPHPMGGEKGGNATSKKSHEKLFHIKLVNHREVFEGVFAHMLK